MGLLFCRAEGELPANFVSPRQPKPAQKLNFRTIRLAVVASIALLVGLVVLGRVLHASWADEVDRLKADNADVQAKLDMAALNAKRLKAINDWDNLVWLDELYDLTARIPDLNAMRIKSVTVEPLPRSTKGEPSKFVAKYTIKGELRLRRGNPRRPLEQMITQFGKDGYYSAEAPKVEGDQFTLVVNVERRSPEEYKYILKEVTDEEAKAAAEAEARAAKAKVKMPFPGINTGGAPETGGFVGGTGGGTKTKNKNKRRTKN